MEKCSECSWMSNGIFCSNSSIQSSKCPFVLIDDTNEMIDYYMYACCKGYE